MDDCIFCKIAAGDVPAKIVYRDDNVVAIEDLNPQAPAHLLVIPREHFPTLVESIANGGDALTAAVFSVAARLGREHGGAGGFRLVVNTGPDGGQTVGHVHVHVLAGRSMAWPPG
jgi:histidine triad (HIT) family protein